MPKAIKPAAYGLGYSPQRTDGDIIAVIGEPKAAVVSVLTAAMKFCPKKRAVAIDPDFPIENAEANFGEPKRTFVIKVERGEASGLYASGGTTASGAAATRFTYERESDARAGGEEIERICEKANKPNFRAKTETHGKTVTAYYEFFNFADCERMTVKLADTLKGDELVETLYAYDAPYQDEYLLSLTKASPIEEAPEFTRLNYYPLIAGRAVAVKFILGEDEDFTRLADLIYSILTEERP